MLLAAVVGMILAVLPARFVAHGDPALFLALVARVDFVALMQLLVYVPIVAFLVVALPRLAHRTLGELGLAMPSLRDLGVAAGAAILMLVAVTAVAGIQAALTHVEPHQDVLEMFKDTPHGLAYLLLTLIGVLFAPFVEELVFRGFVFNAFYRYTPFAVAALASTTVFAALHIVGAHGAQWGVFFPIFAVGLILAWVYRTTGKLSASMTAHGLFNGITLLVTALQSGAPHAS
jgi:membrane protease YdiL (CAAX protease family)